MLKGFCFKLWEVVFGKHVLGCGSPIFCFIGVWIVLVTAAGHQGK